MAQKRAWTWQGADEWYWMAYCPDCDAKLIRYSTENASSDPYYRQSRRKAEERERMRIAMLQPGQSGFRTHYRRQAEDLDKQKEVAETEAKEKKIKNEKKYKKLMATTNLDASTAKKIKKLYLE